MVKIKVFICKESDGSYSCYMDSKSNLPYGLIGEGDTVEEAIQEWNHAYADMKLLFVQEKKDFEEVEFCFTYDVPSFLAYYGGLITFRGLAKLTGVSAAQLSHYATGYRNPSPKTVLKIQDGLRKFASELSNIALV